MLAFVFRRRRVVMGAFHLHVRLFKFNFQMLVFSVSVLPGAYANAVGESTVKTWPV